MASFVNVSLCVLSLIIMAQMLILSISWSCIKPTWIVYPNILAQIIMVVGSLAIWLFSLFAMSSTYQPYLMIAYVMMAMLWIALMFLVILYYLEFKQSKRVKNLNTQHNEVKHIDIRI